MRQRCFIAPAAFLAVVIFAAPPLFAASDTADNTVADNTVAAGTASMAPEAGAGEGTAALNREAGDGSEEALKAGYTVFLEAEVERAFAAHSISLKSVDLDPAASAGKGDRELALMAADSIKAAWGIRVYCGLNGTELSWVLAVYRSSDGALLAADAFSSYAGLAVRGLLSSSADNLAGRWAAAKALERLATPSPAKLHFTSKLEGVSVYLGRAEEGGILLGRIEHGELTAPYIPVTPGQKVWIGISKDGYWSRLIEIDGNISDKPIRLPELMRKSSQALLLMVSPNRNLGATAGYRWHLVPDILYFQMDFSPWFQYYIQPGAAPVLHIETQLGFGAYLPFFAPDSRFRMSLGCGVSSIGTYFPGSGSSVHNYYDFLVTPINMGFEYHFGDWAAVLDYTAHYSLGADSGLLSRGWAESSRMGPVSIFLGGMYTW